MLRPLLHYFLHFGAPILLAMLFNKEHRRKALYIMWATMAVDLDHLLATPVFAPDRMSVGFHPLHTYPAIAIYIILCLLPYQRLHWPWWLRAVGIGLAFHMLTDFLDYTLWH